MCFWRAYAPAPEQTCNSCFAIARLIHELVLPLFERAVFSAKQSLVRPMFAQRRAFRKENKANRDTRPAIPTACRRKPHEVLSFLECCSSQTWTEAHSLRDTLVGHGEALPMHFSVHWYLEPHQSKRPKAVGATIHARLVEATAALVFAWVLLLRVF